MWIHLNMLMTCERILKGELFSCRPKHYLNACRLAI
uniref:Uncharacterized protein n=1 Tax=Anguilla anguilla TaxID=7936 RepID=A0A0E9VRI2_ANGAN